VQSEGSGVEERPLEGTGVSSDAGAAGAAGADSHESRRLRRWIHLLWGTVFLGVTATIHNASPNYFDGDTGYHLAVAEMTRKYGILQSFPWTPFSWLAEHYADKEFLFHVILIPLVDLDPNLAARIAGSVLGAGLLLTLYAFLTKEKIPQAGWWALLPLAISSAFINRFALVRPHMLSIPLALAITWSAARRRFGWLALCCFVYPFCYTAWHLPLVLVGIVEGVRVLGALRDGRPVVRAVEWRGVALMGVASLAGIALHPNFPNNVELFKIINYTVLFDTAWSGKEGFEMGGEFKPFSPLSVLRYVALPALAAGAAAALAWRRRADATLPLALALTALAFFVITLRTQRFIEYLAPFAVFALAVAWPRERGRGVAPALVAFGSIWIVLFARHPIELLLDRIDAFPVEVTQALQEVIPEGEQVVTCEWHATGEMMLALPERRFIVALDPVFFAVNDPERYRLWFETVRRPPENSAVLLRDTFDARFVVCDTRMKWLPLMQALEGDEFARLRGIYGFWVVFELLDEPAVPPLAMRKVETPLR